MSRLPALVLVLGLALGGCGWFATSPMPEAAPVPVEHLGLVLQAPPGWTPAHEPELGRTRLWAPGGKDRDHAVIVQRLPSSRGWRDHADRFRAMQEQVLDKIQSEQDHDIAGGGVRFETLRQREGEAPVRKYVYYVELGEETLLLDMAAPAKAFDGPLYQAMARSLAALEAE
jgi:hypothetical protein